jgi:16S rRNA (uracil1498-N3)-methyltransferase
MNAKTRLFVDQPLAKGNRVSLTQPQAHYLFGVMRLAVGGAVSLFNGRDGEWRGEIIEAGKRKGTLECSDQTKVLQTPPDLWLCFAPIKKTRTDFIVEKAAEMGAAKICPMQTEYTNSERVKQERLQAHAIEAAEQCGATFVPEVTELRKLGAVLDHWPEERQIMFCDEVELGAATSLATATCGPWAIFIGPEGGFSPTERTRLHAMPQAHVVSLGPRILRADTAAVAALTLWQFALGDWSQ